MTIFLISILISAITVSLLASAFSKINTLYQQKEQSDFDRNYLLANTDIDVSKIDEMFDTIINNCIEEYMLLNIPFKPDQFINSTIEQTMLLEVSNLVTSRMTVAIISRLSLIYIVETDEQLSDLITKNVYIRLLPIIVDHNRFDNDNLKPIE